MIDMERKSEKEAVASKSDPEAALLGALGLAARARKLECGTDRVCDALKEGRVYVVVRSGCASHNTQKRLSDRCAFYGVPLITAQADAYRLGSSVGRHGETAATAVTDENLAKLVVAAANKAEK